MNKTISVFSYAGIDAISEDLLSSATLTMRMLSNGFCVSVSTNDKTILYLEQYAFSSELSLAEKIDEMEDARKKTGIACGENVFQLYTNINTQIPEEYYVERLNDTIADLLVSDSKEYVPMTEKIDRWNLYNLSLWDRNLLEKIKGKFPNYQLKTVLGALLEKISARLPKKEAFIFVENNNFTVIATNEKGLLAANSFAFETESDFLYYSLAFLRKFYQNMHELSVFLCGNISQESPLFLSMNKYFSGIELTKEESVNNMENVHYYCDIL